MKTPSAVFSLLLAASLLATDGQAYAIRRAEAGFSEAPGHALLERAPIPCNQPRGLEDEVSQVVSTGSKGTAYAMFTIGYGALAASVCSQLSRKTSVALTDCRDYTSAIAGTAVIAFGAMEYKSSGTSSTSRRRSDGSFATVLTDLFDEVGVSFNSMTSLPIVNRRFVTNQTYANETSASPTIVGRLSIAGLNFANSTTDALVTHYSDDTGNIFVTPPSSAAVTNSTMGLTKRHDGPGFKVNYALLKRGRYIGSPNIGASVQLSQGLAQDWFARTQNGINEYLGTAYVTGIESIGFRIIPETQGFGDNYESVTVCGSMRVGHDEL